MSTESPIKIWSPCRICCCSTGTPLTSVPLRLFRSRMENCPLPSATSTQCRRDKAGSATQSWLDESRPIDTSPAGKGKAEPFNGPLMPRSRGFVSWSPYSLFSTDGAVVYT